MKHQQNALTQSTQRVTPDTRRQDLLSAVPDAAQHPILWIDGVGGFLLVASEEALVGQAIPGGKMDIAIVGDVSRQAAAIRRSGGDYLLQPLQNTRLNEQPIDRPQLLGSGDTVHLGKRVKLQFHKPSPLSSSARLSLVSVNRFQPNVDGILLLADSCIIGPNPSSHIQCPQWKHEVLLFRKDEQWVFRIMQEVEVNGVQTEGHIPMQPGMRIRGEDFSLSVE